MSNRFGRRLYMLFFKSYTEKVWGVSTTEIRAEWAAQRIKGVSSHGCSFGAPGARGSQVKSLIHEFHYPRYGPGQMWEAMAGSIAAGRWARQPRRAGCAAARWPTGEYGPSRRPPVATSRVTSSHRFRCGRRSRSRIPLVEVDVSTVLPGYNTAIASHI